MYIHTYVRTSHTYLLHMQLSYKHAKCPPAIHTRLTSACVDGGRAEGLPHNGLTDVGGNEEGYATGGRDVTGNFNPHQGGM